MEIMSRGVTPRAFSPPTKVASEAPVRTVRNCLPFSSSTETSLCGTTAVWPVRAKAPGWLTAGCSRTVMVRLPCWMATVETRTESPMTITPATSSITTLAGESGSTERFSTWAMKATRF
jgi:hypothetical protein